MLDDYYITSDDKEPVGYCIRHGLQMKITMLTSYDGLTGKKVLRGYKGTCPKWFCIYSSHYRVVGPPPNMPPSKK